MIKVSLEHHDPNAIYQHITSFVGTCYMLIKSSFGIFSFEEPTAAQTVLNIYQTWRLDGHRLNVSKYVKGELDVMNQQHVNLNQQLKNIQEQPKNPTQKILMGYKKNMIKVINHKYEEMMEWCTQQIKVIDNQFPNNYDKIFQKQTLNQYITTIMNKNLNSYKKSMREMSQLLNKRQYKKKKIIEQEIKQVIMIQEQPELSFFNEMQFVNQQKLGIKRIQMMFDSTVFVVSEYKSIEQNEGGLIKLYDVNNSMAKKTYKLYEKPYSLCAFDNNWILCGNKSGSINFIDLSDLQNNDGECSQKLHDGFIYDVKNFHNKGKNSSILTLSSDQTIKIWEVQKLQTLPKLYTLEFHQTSIRFPLKESVYTFQVLDSQNIAWAHKSIVRYNCQKNRQDCIESPQQIISIVKRYDQQLIIAAERTIEIADFRCKKITNKCQFRDSQVMCLKLMNENYVYYGTKLIKCGGELGIVDLRKMNYGPLWKNTSTHKDRIGDLGKLEEGVIAGDYSGSIIKWVPVQ